MTRQNAHPEQSMLSFFLFSFLLPFYNYSPGDLDQFEYDHLGQNFNTSTQLNNFLSSNNLNAENQFFNIVGNRIQLSEYGLNKASQYDELAYLEKVNGNYLGYSNHTEDYFIGGKLNIKDLVFGGNSF